MTSIDHLVVAGTDLSALVAWWTAQSGQPAVTGGAHVGMGTRNALVGLGSSYLELIGPDPAQDAPSQPRPFGIDELPDQSIRLVTLALTVDDLDAALAEMAANDVAFGPARPMLRAKPNGTVLSWRLALPNGFDGVMPFLIEWGDGVEHPSASLAEGCSIIEIEGSHPEADRLNAALEAIGAPYAVKVDDRAGLSAELATPKGTVTL